MLDRFRHLLDYVKELDDTKVSSEGREAGSSGSSSKSSSKLASVGRSVSVRESRSLTRVSERDVVVTSLSKTTPGGGGVGGSSTASNTPRTSSRHSSTIFNRQQSVPSQSLNSTPRSPLNTALLAATSRRLVVVDTDHSSNRKENVIVPSKNDQFMLGTLISPDNTKSQTLPANLTPSQLALGHSARTVSSVDSNRDTSTSDSSSDVSSESDADLDPGTPSMLRKLGAILKTKEGAAGAGAAAGATTGSLRSVSSSISGRGHIEMVTDNEAPSSDERDQSQREVSGVVKKRGKAALNGGEGDVDTVAIATDNKMASKTNGHPTTPLPSNGNGLLSAQASMTSSASAEPKSLSLSMTSERSQTKDDVTTSLSSTALTTSLTSAQYDDHVIHNDDRHINNHRQHRPSQSSSSSSSSESDSDKENKKYTFRPNSDVTLANGDQKKKNPPIIFSEQTQLKSDVKLNETYVISANGSLSNGIRAKSIPDDANFNSSKSVVSVEHTEIIYHTPAKHRHASLSFEDIVENSKNNNKNNNNNIRTDGSMSAAITGVSETVEVVYLLPGKTFSQEGDDIVNCVENITSDGGKVSNTAAARVSQLTNIEERYLEGILDDDSTDSSDGDAKVWRLRAVTIATDATPSRIDTDMVKVRDVNMADYCLIHEPTVEVTSEVHYYLPGQYFDERTNENIANIISANGEGCNMLYAPSVTEAVEQFASLPGKYFVEITNESVAHIISANGEGCNMLYAPSVTEAVEEFALLPGLYFLESLERSSDNEKVEMQLIEGCEFLQPATETVEVFYLLPEQCFVEVTRTPKRNKVEEDEIVQTETVNGEGCKIVSSKNVQVFGVLPGKLFLEEKQLDAVISEAVIVTPQNAEMHRTRSAPRVTYAPEIEEIDNHNKVVRRREDDAYLSADAVPSPPSMFADQNDGDILATTGAFTSLPKRASTSTTLDDLDGCSSSSDFPPSLGWSASAYNDHVTLTRPSLQPVLAEEIEFVAPPVFGLVSEDTETVYNIPARTADTAHIDTLDGDLQTKRKVSTTSSSSTSVTGDSESEDTSSRRLEDLLLPPVLYSDDAAIAVEERVEAIYDLPTRYFHERVSEEHVTTSQTHRQRKRSSDVDKQSTIGSVENSYNTAQSSSNDRVREESVTLFEGKIMADVTSITTSDEDEHQVEKEESVQLHLARQQVSQDTTSQPTFAPLTLTEQPATSRGSATSEHIEFVVNEKVFHEVPPVAPARRRNLQKRKPVKDYKQSSHKHQENSSSSDSDMSAKAVTTVQRLSSAADDVMLVYLLAEQKGMKWEVIEQLHKTRPAPPQSDTATDDVDAVVPLTVAATAAMLGSALHSPPPSPPPPAEAVVTIEDEIVDVLNAKVTLPQPATATVREETIEQLASRSFSQTDDCVKYVVATDTAAMSAEHIEPEPQSEPAGIEPEVEPVVLVTVVNILEGRCVLQTQTTVSDLAEKVTVPVVMVANAEGVGEEEEELIKTTIQMEVIDDVEGRSFVQTETCVDELPGKTTVGMETVESVGSEVEPVVVTTVVMLDDLEGRTVLQEDTCVDDLPDKVLLVSAVTLAAVAPPLSDPDSYDTSLTPAAVTVIDDLQERTIAQAEYTVEDLPDRLAAGAVIIREDLDGDDGIERDDVIVAAGAAGLAVYHGELIHISEEEVIEGDNDVFFSQEDGEMLVQQEQLERYLNTEVTSDSGVVMLAVAEGQGRPKSHSASSSKKLHLSSESERESVVEELTVVQKTGDDSPRPLRPAAVEALRSRGNTSGSQESLASVYSQAGRGGGRAMVTGDVELGVQYDYKASCLLVHVRQCRGLYADPRKKKTDPYVKTYLLPDKTKNGKRRTKARKNTTDPVFNEKLKYEVNRSVLDSRVLWVSVWHSEQFGRNEFLGEINLSLIDCNLDTEVLRWYKLQPKPCDEEEHSMPVSMLSYKGDLHVSLKFACSEGLPSLVSPGELHVVIHEARNLAAIRLNSTSNPFCKGYLLPDKSKNAQQKTPVVKRDCNPKWQYEFIFRDVSLTQLYERCLELTIWDHGTTNDFLGGVRMGLGPGKSRLRDAADWMDSWGEEVQLWQAMLDRANRWIEGTLLLRPHMDRRK